MAILNDIITRLRRYLRDPDGDIWSDDDILLYWNQSQVEIQQKTWILARADAYRYPPEFRWSYMWDHEHTQTDGDRFQCLTQWQAGDMIVCF